MAQPQLEIGVLGDIPRWHARVHGEAVALQFRDEQATFRDLDRRSNQVAHGLLSAGVRDGARVAVLDQDSDAAVEVLFGSAKANGVLMGINWRLTPAEIRYILEHGEATVLFVGEAFLAKIEASLPELPHLETIIVLSGSSDRWPSYRSWRDAQPDHDPALPSDPESVVVQMYTSGTTGHPKGVMLAHRSFFAVVRGMRSVGDPWIGWSADDVSLLSFPLFHIGGLWWAMTTLCAGARLIVVGSFVAWQALELIQRHGVTKACMVPAMIQMLLAEPTCATTDFSTLEHMVYGGSPITRTCLTKAMERFGCGFAQIYGLTETGNTAVCLRPEDHGRDDLLKAAGRPYPNVRAKVVDASGNPLDTGEVGEVCLHSPANMVGYWKNPEATAQTLIDGWIHTGDAGHIDDEGYVFVSDRIKDMIICAGENIYPAEVESVLASHPAILETAVIGVPDERWGELVKAVVVLRPGMSAPSAELLAHCRRDLADFKVPRSVDFIDALPRTPSGKVRKHILRKPYWEGRDRQVN